MADHLAEQPTQAKYPWRAALRTFVQTLPAALALAVAAPALVAAFLGAAAPVLPPEVVAWLTVTAAAVSAVAAGIARLMAVPAVNQFLTRIGLGATPKN